MLILQFFGGFVVSLLASIGVLQTPGPEGFGFPETPDGDPVIINRRLSDACLMDGFALGLYVSFGYALDIPRSAKSNKFVLRRFIRIL